MIGHTRFVSEDITPQEIAETLWTYNAHAARMEVITYESLLESARRMLALSSARQDSGPSDQSDEPAT